MDINNILIFFDANKYILLCLIPFLSQIGILPFGAMFFITFSGAMADNIDEVGMLFLIVLGSSIIGDSVGYFLGRKLLSVPGFHTILKINRIKTIFDTGRKFFDIKGGIAIFLSRFLVSGLGAPINYITGIESFGYKKFFYYMFSGEIIYAGGLLCIGYFFKNTFEEILNIASNFGFLMLLAFVLYQFGRFIWIKKIFKN